MGAAPQVDAGVPDEEGLPGDRPRSVGRTILSGFVSFGVVALIFAFLIPQLTASGASVQGALSSIEPRTWLAGTLLGLLNLASNWPPICVGLPGLRIREAGVNNTATAALSNTVPEGGAVATGLTYAMQRSWGFSLSNITRGFMATGIWTNLVRYGLTAVALVVLAGQEDEAKLTAVAVVAAVLATALATLLFMVLGSERFAAGLGRFTTRVARPFAHLIRKDVADLAPTFVDFRADLTSLLRTRWHALTLTMFASQAIAILLLGALIRLQGIPESEITWARIVVAWGLSMLAALIVPVPGGLGVIEAALLAILGVGLPSSDANALLGAVIVYRAATWLLPIPIGAGTYLYWRYNRSWRHAPDERDPGTGALLAGA